MNKCILVGRLVKDVECMQTGQSLMAKGSIAVKRSYKNREGNYDTDFINFVAFGNQANYLSMYCKKGNMILVSGALQQDNYVAKDGTNHSSFVILADNIENYSSRETTKPTQQYNNYQNNQPRQQPQSNFYTPQQNNGSVINDKDLPF